jgi:hypothetical protein
MTDLTALRHADPAAGLDLDPDACRRMDAVIERLMADEPWPQAVPRLRRVRRARRAGLVLATAAACGAGLVVALPGNGGHAVPAASAATVLRDARAAALRFDGPGPWTVTVTREWRGVPFRTAGGRWAMASVPYTIEDWASDDGTQLERQTRGEIRFDNAADATAYKDDPRADSADPNEGKIVELDRSDGVGPTVAEIHAWPTDPSALAAKLRGQGDDSTVQYAVSMLESPLPTAELRAAIYTLLLRTPGARLESNVTDPEGRTGDGVRFVSVDTRPGTEHVNQTYDTTLVFDRETHALLGVRDIGTENGKRRESWSLVLDAHRAAQAPKPDVVQSYPAGSHGQQAPTYVPAG